MGQVLHRSATTTEAVRRALDVDYAFHDPDLDFRKTIKRKVKSAADCTFVVPRKREGRLLVPFRLRREAFAPRHHKERTGHVHQHTGLRQFFR